MRLLPLAALAAIALVVAGPADAKKKKTFCQKTVKAQRAKVKAKNGGVTFYMSGNTVNACSDKLKVDVGLLIVGDGVKIQAAKAQKHGRCVAIYSASKSTVPQLLYTDLKTAHDTGSSVAQIGYPTPGGRVVSFSLSKNCGLAWGESAGGVRRVRLVSAGPGNSLTEGLTTEVATVQSDADVKGVTAKPAGKRVKVSWKQGGQPMSQVFPTPAP